MPTNEQRRATAKRKLERQLERRAQQARRRRLVTAVAGVVVLVAAIGAIAAFVLRDKDKDKTDTTSSAATTSVAPGEPSAAPPVTGGLPAFKASADLGANCQYPASPEAASKPVAAPNAGQVPTDPATVSVSMATNQGNIGLMLDNSKSPCTVNSFASLAQKGFFNDTPCHRLTTSPSLAVLQCGDPSGSGSGGPGYTFANEYPTNQYPQGDPALQQPVTYPRGTLAMANAGPDTNGSQFFLVYKDSQLPPNYTVFGTIDETGLATLDKIAAGGVTGGGEDGKPAADVRIKSVLLD